jgi:hypothetical protein
MPLEIEVIAYPQNGGVLVEPQNINGIGYVGLEVGEPYAVKLRNTGDRRIRAKLWIGNYLQQRRATSLLQLAADLLTRKDSTVWELRQGDEVLHPAGSHFSLTAEQMATVVAKAYDGDGNEIDHTGVVLVWEQLLNNMVRKERA